MTGYLSRLMRLGQYLVQVVDDLLPSTATKGGCFVYFPRG